MVDIFGWVEYRKRIIICTALPLFSFVRCCSRSLIRPSRRCRRSLLHLFFCCNPILISVVERVYHLRDYFESLSDFNHRPRVLMSAAVVSCREHSKQLPASESFEPVHDALMRPQNELALVVFQELTHSVRSELHNVACAIGISYKVRLNSQFLVVISRVAP